MILHVQTGEHLGWFSWNNAYDRADCINEATYSFYFGENKPDNNVMPYELEDTFYIGMACGKYYDLKNRKNWNGKFKKYLQKRFLDHNKYLSTLIVPPTNTDKPLPKKRVLELKKSKIFFEHFSPILNPQCQRWVSITLPPKDCKTVALRSQVNTVEKLYTLEYTKRFDNLPLLNFDEVYESDRQRNSYSNRMMSSPSVLKFCE